MSDGGLLPPVGSGLASPSPPAVDTPAVDPPAVDTPAVDTPAVDTPAVLTPAVTTIGLSAGRGTRSRAGNAMARSREALLDGAARCLAERGLRATSMSEVVRRAGVAKATVYNHFRTKDQLWRALAERELALAAERARGAAVEGGAAGGLASLAVSAGAHPVLTRLRADEPAALVAAVHRVGAPDDPLGGVAREALAALLGRPGGGPSVEAALRWLAGCAVVPSPSPGDEAVLLARTLALVAPTAPPVSAPGPLAPARAD